MSESNWFIYIIQAATGILYTGITTDPQRRIEEHSEGKTGARALRGKGPLKMVYLESAENRSEASKREAAIKRLPRLQKLALIADQSSTKKETP